MGLKLAELYEAIEELGGPWEPGVADFEGVEVTVSVELLPEYDEDLRYTRLRHPY